MNFSKKYLLPVFLLAAGITLPLFAAENPARQKMVWAHYVPWGFNQHEGYDTTTVIDTLWNLLPFNSRSLAGRYIQWDSGIYSGSQKQIHEAMFWGIDGFCVDVTSPDAYVWMMERFFHDAEGTPFKIALCIDKIGNDTVKAADALEKFIRTYQNHPNACLIDGRMVIFSYWLGEMGAEQFSKVRAELKKRNVDAYFLLQPMHETSKWDNPALLKAMAKAGDGFYDFGCNGLAPEDVIGRLANGRKVLAAENPEGILCAGIAQGYLGHGNGAYRPFSGTESLRQNWESAIVNKAEWVCLTTWNDYGEHTNFEPNAVDRSALVRLNREFVDLWRGVKPVARPPQIWVSYQEEVLYGDDLKLEFLSSSYTTAPAKGHLRLLKTDGSLFKEFEAIALPKDKLTPVSFRVKPAELKDLDALCVQYAVTEGDKAPEWVELYPILRRPDHKVSLRTIRQASADLGRIQAGIACGENRIHIQINGHDFAGKVEILRNGWPIAEEEVNHHGKQPFWNSSYAIPQRSVAPVECYVARVSDAAGRVNYSNPVFYTAKQIPGTSRQPIIVNDCDFDEAWPLWQGKMRVRKPKIQFVNVPNDHIFALHYDLAKPADIIFSDSGWDYAALLGRNPNFDSWTKEELKPKWVETQGPDGTKRLVPRFTGRENIRVMARRYPAGPVTIRMTIRPERFGGVLFDCAGTILELNSEGKVVFSRRLEGNSGSSVTGNIPVKMGEWNTITAVYTGNSVDIVINGQNAGSAKAEPISFGINNVPTIGNVYNSDNGFCGEIADFYLAGGVPTNN